MYFIEFTASRNTDARILINAIHIYIFINLQIYMFILHAFVYLNTLFSSLSWQDEERETRPTTSGSTFSPRRRCRRGICILVSIARAKTAETWLVHLAENASSSKQPLSHSRGTKISEGSIWRGRG